METGRKIAAGLQQVFYPRTGTPEAAARAMRNGGGAGWIMVAVHFLLGAVLIILIVPEQSRISGDALIPATIQLFLALLYGALGTYCWRGSRVAAWTLLVVLVLDTLLLLARVPEPGPQLAVHVFAMILAIGAVRGSAASRRHERGAL